MQKCYSRFEISFFPIIDEGNGLILEDCIIDDEQLQDALRESLFWGLEGYVLPRTN